MNWEYKSLNELGTISRGRSKHRPRNDTSLFGGKYPFVQTADVKAANLYLTKYSETYNDKGLEQSKLWKAGTLCITIAANIADTAILGIDACFPDSIMGFTPFEGVSNVKFIKYAFDMLQRDCKQISQGTAQDNLSWEKLSTIKFPAPDIKVQNKIADYISAYDDLIENNQKQIKLLEEAAQRLYKEWFVDLRFPGYGDCKIVDGVPEGWKRCKVTDFLEIKYGKDHKALEDGDISVYGSGGIIRKVKPIIYSGESVLIPRKGSLNNIMYVTGDFWTIDTMFYSEPQMENIVKYTYLFLKRLDMYSFNIGAAEGKSNGLIIDYIGIVKALRKALADYTANAGGRSTDPTVDKSELIERVLEVIAAADEFLNSKGFILNNLISALDFAKLALLQEAANTVCDSKESKKQFMTYGNELNRMMKYLDRHDISDGDRQKKEAIIAIYDGLKKKKKHVDTVDLMVQINGILSEYILIEQTPENRSIEKRFDISKIDFDLLRREFAKVKKKNLMFMELDELIQTRLDEMLKANPKRIDYYERYQKIIEEYNQEQDQANIEKMFMELMDLANSLNQEEQRYVREGFTSDEELSLYDMLFDENLSKEDINKIKKVAVELLDKIKGKISELDHWTDKQETKAEVDTLIGKILWEGLPECYSDSAIFTYRQKIYEYVYMRYKEVA